MHKGCPAVRCISRPAQNGGAQWDFCRDPLLWLIAVFVALLVAMPYLAALFGTLFPQLPRPVYQQESFVSLTLAHFWLVGVSRSLLAIVIGLGRELQ